MAENLTKETFSEKVIDFASSEPGNYKGDIPALIDFYADWCGPCKMVAPIIQQLSEEYDGKLNVWKVDTDAEPELSAHFNVTSIPTFLFIPVGGEPIVKAGGMPKAAFIKIIKEQLGVE